MKDFPLKTRCVLLVVMSIITMTISVSSCPKVIRKSIKISNSLYQLIVDVEGIFFLLALSFKVRYLQHSLIPLFRLDPTV